MRKYRSSRGCTGRVNRRGRPCRKRASAKRIPLIENCTDGDQAGRSGSGNRHPKWYKGKRDLRRPRSPRRRRLEHKSPDVLTQWFRLGAGKFSTLGWR